jgi:NAD(P)-dependent dehydrogenase (short-subunit alcohol dehydrogenase family)
LRLARDGHAAGALDLDEARCAGTVDEITAAGGKAIALGADISDRAQVRAALAKLRSAFGPITVLVKNAGIAESLPFEEITDELWDRMFAVNVRGAFRAPPRGPGGHRQCPCVARPGRDPLCHRTDHRGERWRGRVLIHEV